VAEIDNPLRFQGQYYDAETGLHYNRHRYYNPNTGHFLTPDPIKLAGGLNHYQYVPNPTGWVDPLGLSSIDCPNGNSRNTANATKPADLPMSQEKFDEVINLERGNRPSPKEYLPEEYIQTHEQEFARQGGSFIVVEDWITRSRYPEFPPRKFVGLPSEMEAIVSKYKANGRDWRTLNDDLNLGSTALSGTNLYLVRIKLNDSRFSFEMPTGNEAGAYPQEWVPGGRTKSGTKEVALVGSENIEHSQSMERLLEQFDDWEKL